jgi:hypothetical protein
VWARISRSLVFVALSGLLALAAASSTVADSPGPAPQVAAISAGGAHTCAIMAGGELACWGNDSKGQLEGVPEGQFAAVSAGGAHTCAIRLDGRLVCWGDDSKGQLEGVPEGRFTAVSAGGAHTCAVRSDAELLCWGDDSAGQLDEIPGGQYVDAAAGGTHTCAIRTNGHMKCWGDESAGQRDGAPFGSWWNYVQPHSQPDYLAVSAGGGHTCAIDEEHELGCWGLDSSGEVSGMPSGHYLAVSAGGAHTCAIGTERQLRCWGEDAEGQSGQAPQGEFADVSAGGAHSCAVDVAGKASCWGANQFGQSYPRMISGEPQAASVGVPYHHTFEATRQVPALSFSVGDGDLPDGLFLDPSGELSGTPTAAGAFTFTVVTDNGVTGNAEEQVTLDVLASDGPAPPPPAPAAIAIAPPPVSEGLPPPVAGESANLDPVEGLVRVRCPGEGDFTRVPRPVQISLACVVDASDGTANLTTSRGAPTDTQTADFWGGMFGLAQKPGVDQETVLSLAGRKKCQRRKPGESERGRIRYRRRGAGRSLWGSGEGNYKTEGDYGSATVRGTTWLVTDRCNDSTSFKVLEGTVWVEDFSTGKSVILVPGGQYIAKGKIDRLQ